MNYKEQYLDPRWQKKRLEVLSRDNFSCQSCGEKSKTLHVHHYEYHEGKKIWEYKEQFLGTYCEYCHKEKHRDAYLSVNSISELLKKKYQDEYDLSWIYDVLKRFDTYAFLKMETLSIKNEKLFLKELYSFFDSFESKMENQKNG